MLRTLSNAFRTTVGFSQAVSESSQVSACHATQYRHRIIIYVTSSMPQKSLKLLP
eukprot:COSAG06_NODE_3555_length_5193_cov_37.761288_4_plen_55_part_00